MEGPVVPLHPPNTFRTDYKSTFHYPELFPTYITISHHPGFYLLHAIPHDMHLLIMHDILKLHCPFSC